MNESLDNRLKADLDALRRAGTYKTLRHLQSPMAPVVQMEGYGEVIVLSSNNYLGLANHPEVVQAGIDGLKKYGAGTASVRFICGTFECHRLLEEKLAEFLGKEAALTYVSCWNANEGLVPALVGEGDVVISDELNHASIIDACRLLRGAQKTVYKHGDMADLEAKLQQFEKCRTKLIITDGVFSMEGDIAKLSVIRRLAQQYNAVVTVDDSHGTGVIGVTGRGIEEFTGAPVDIITSTLGKALGGAAGGFVAGSKALIDTLIQRSRPQLFSNALPPTVACSALKAIEVLERHPELVETLLDNVGYFRKGLKQLGYKPLEGDSAIIPIIVGETAFAIKMSDMLLKRGVFVTGFGFPVVPEGKARVRVQMSAALEKEHLDRALDAFQSVGKELKLNP